MSKNEQKRLISTYVVDMGVIIYSKSRGGGGNYILWDQRSLTLD